MCRDARASGDEQNAPNLIKKKKKEKEGGALLALGAVNWRWMTAPKGRTRLRAGLA